MLGHPRKLGGLAVPQGRTEHKVTFILQGTLSGEVKKHMLRNRPRVISHLEISW